MRRARRGVGGWPPGQGPRTLPLSALLLGLLIGAACDEGDVRLGPKQGGPKPRDAGVYLEIDELDRLLPGKGQLGRGAAVRTRDVRALLPRTPFGIRARDRVFALVPIGRSWHRVGWRAATVLSVDPRRGSTVRLEEGREITGVPAALILASAKDRPRVGEVVRAAIGRELPYARVARFEGDRVVVRTVFLGEVREAILTIAEIMRVPAGLEKAAPVVFRLPAGHRIGIVIAAEHKHWWVLGPEAVIHRLPWTDVTALSLGRTLGSGDLVRAALPMNLRTVTVTRVLDPGLRFEVGWDQTRREVVCFSSLAPL